MIQPDILYFVGTLMNVCVARTNAKKRRQAARRLRRLNWDEYCLRHPFFVQRSLRMSVESFTNLVDTLGDALNIDEKQGRRRGDHIQPELRLFCTIRWLAGGSYLDIAGLVGVSSSRLYQIIDKTIHAIATSSKPALNNIRFPNIIIVLTNDSSPSKAFLKMQKTPRKPVL
ncbi:hypothetical protein IV203_030841 [Nitzschia inconspicua]|uniref:Uncharacterized protein n=1 Tax=Nitzschia inconspicua TaxID=303405 RepID=A0A9K3Q239_9STRA|nr:hypothetical protein IV203_030841 [Nitzschia inconspicua]